MAFSCVFCRKVIERQDEEYLIVVRAAGESQTSTSFAHPNCYVQAKTQPVESERLISEPKRRRA
jgi:hypothetical protein